jgi:hypothetical protein
LKTYLRSLKECMPRIRDVMPILVMLRKNFRFIDLPCRLDLLPREEWIC